MPAGVPNRAQARQDVAILAEALRGSPVLDALMRLAQIDGDIKSVVEVQVQETIDTRSLVRDLVRELGGDGRLSFELSSDTREFPVERLPDILANVYAQVKSLKTLISSGAIDHDDIDAILSYISTAGEQHG